jgi:hypothetical protein
MKNSITKVLLICVILILLFASCSPGTESTPPPSTENIAFRYERFNFWFCWNITDESGKCHRWR